MKFLPYVLLLILPIVSCRVLKVHTATSFHSGDNGEIKAINPEEHVKISFFGDYFFHEVTSDSILFPDKDILSSIRKASLKKPVILFCGHTTITPFCCTIGISYPSTPADSCSAKTIRHFQETGKIYSLKSIDTTFVEGSLPFKRLTFRYYSPILQVSYHVSDYYHQSGETTYRFLFWTLGNAGEWFNNETEVITSTLTLTE